MTDQENSFPSSDEPAGRLFGSDSERPVVGIDYGFPSSAVSAYNSDPTGDGDEGRGLPVPETSSPPGPVTGRRHDPVKEAHFRELYGGGVVPSSEVRVRATEPHEPRGHSWCLLTKEEWETITALRNGTAKVVPA